MIKKATQAEIDAYKAGATPNPNATPDPDSLLIPVKADGLTGTTSVHANSVGIDPGANYQELIIPGILVGAIGILIIFAFIYTILSIKNHQKT